jgi:cyclophilin family peptidyl-prolyl cis-trans isomerase
MKLTLAAVVMIGCSLAIAAAQTAKPAPAPTQKPAAAPAAKAGPAPVIVLETAKGTIEIETYPVDAPKTVEHIVALVKKNFYNGMRFHRAEDNFLVQVGDPQSRDMSREAWWGRGPGSGSPIGVAEITKKYRHVAGTVAMAHVGDPKLADSQFYIIIQPRPGLDGKYTIFGHVTTGMDVVKKLKKADILKKASLKE